MRVLLRCLPVLALFLSLSVSAFAQCTIQTDKGDYAPGETAYITGAGWQAGETVDLDLQKSYPNAPVDWNTTADADGKISTSYLVMEADLNVSFVLSAYGESSTCSPHTLFTGGGDKIGSISITNQFPNPVMAGNTCTYLVTLTRFSGKGSSGNFTATITFGSLPAG